MDRELKNLHLNISQLAALSGAHRQTVAARVKNISPTGGHESNLKLYRLTDILAELMKAPLPVDNEEMDPHARKAWYQSERDRLKFEQETGQLVPVSDVRRSFSVVVKAIVQVLETWPDRLERDRGWTASQLNEVQIVVDEIRDTLEKAVIDCCDEADM
ncbi:DUF1441 family protein [Escherichia coli]|jgi:hypothetical protein|uniref:DUF1441 family protein n=3 Tax=Escherichia coli TaxID=562 RepID=UPI00026E1154|nr:DUF1441 family protein [Escherichia coli]AGR48355.1 hypothetical protein [Escherichia phage 1720a-02]EEZ5765529.1 DUF1441 family protein [Escherichia coli O140]EKF4585406.1 DUF1441 family protein [Escherichia coli O26]EKH6186362.1 DUF1441 family protein [Escherichia coli O111]EKH6195560.1 DUF1441 family protein [Escherichia coli O103]EKY3873543.1 DUF1441 family protein [Escherichia coli O157]ELC0846289.1 DUF1441 family protein [Escherichia coli O22]HBC2936922.1 DUF1441 family protein [Es